jgi:hypothetical protein
MVIALDQIFTRSTSALAARWMKIVVTVDSRMRPAITTAATQRITPRARYRYQIITVIAARIASHALNTYWINAVAKPSSNSPIPSMRNQRCPANMVSAAAVTTRNVDHW